jgi:uncharacterized membrane protein
MQSPFWTGVRRAHAVLVANCFYPLIACTLLSLSFLATRFAFTGSLHYRFLVWNVFLAWVPYGCAVGLAWLREDGEETRRKRRRFTGVLVGIAWLVTFPNAPYILTDVVHLLRGSVFRWWFDAGLILSFALTGCFLGVASLRIVHTMIRERAGELIGWATVLLSAVLCGFGIYLGRFLRFNSWDVLTEPWRVMRAVAVRIVDPIDHPQTYGVTLMFAALVLACYGVFTSVGTRAQPTDAAR